MMRVAFICIAIVVGMAEVVVADELRFGYDIAQFKHDDRSNRVELHFAVADTQFVYKKENGVLKGYVDITVLCVSGLDTVDRQSFSFQSTLIGRQDTNRRTMVQNKTMVLKAGRYTLYVKAVDRQRPMRRDSVRVPLVVRAFPGTRAAVSDMLICDITSDSLGPSAGATSLKPVTIPSRELSGDMPVLRSYVELYPVTQSKSGDSITLTYAIQDAARRPILDMSYALAADNKVLPHFFEQPVHILPSGVYYLVAFITSIASTDTFQTTKKFYIINPAYPPELSDLFSEDQLFLSSEFATMSIQRIQEEYEKAKRVGPDLELVSFQQLSTLNAKQKFIFRFWYHKDPNPTTVVNERYEDFKKAVEHAKLNFANPFTPRGWDSDRGRVILRYGFPTNINRVLYNYDGAFPHEIWEYDNIQGGVIFVFVDKRGSGNVTLVHSTALNEHRDELWYKRYAVDPSQNK